MSQDVEYWKNLYELERAYNRALQKELDDLDDFNIYTQELQSEKLKRKTN